MSDYYKEKAPLLVEKGFDVTPTNGKRPFLDYWNTRPAEAKKFHKFYRSNAGVLCGGPKHIIAIDVDVRDPATSAEIENLLNDLLGPAPKRIGAAPKFLYVFRAPYSLKKRESKTFTIAGQTCAIEILGEGQQFIAYGTHPETGSEYQWPNDELLDFSADQLPLVSEQELAEFLQQGERIMQSRAELPPSPSSNDPLIDQPQHSGLLLTKNETRLEKLIRGEGWHNPLRDLAASYAKLGLTRGEMMHLFRPFRQPGYTVEETEKELASLIDSALKKFSKTTTKRDTKRRPIETPLEVYLAEPISWLIEDLIPEVGVGIISGASGSFKSYICGYLALCIANGVEFYPGVSSKRGRSLYTAHEGRRGMGRRLVATANYYDLDQSVVGLWEGITLANFSDIEWLKTYSDRFDLVIIDTLSKATPGIDENSNSEMAAAIEIAYNLSTLWQCFVLIVAHTGKDQSRGTRGASALKANVDTMLLVKRQGDSRFVTVSVEKQKDGDDSLILEFQLQNTEVTHGLTGEIESELVPIPINQNMPAAERIKEILRDRSPLPQKAIIKSVTRYSAENDLMPISDSPIKMALSRGVENKQITKDEDGYRLALIV
ncbi:MAG: AAA family ATPase [Alphaproteobacteria bacterium]